jgi:DNA (cytosine-5)-methyltransferase 1
MTHGSLFSGIGGFDLAAEWMGWENIFHCEWNEFGQKILKYYWPDATSYTDITKTDFSIHRGTIDILTGGFPCQPYSLAGKRKGKEDSRHLWPEMLRAIREIQPAWIVAENVLGLVNWNDGMVFEQVQDDLENEGYEVQAYVLPACGIEAPHERSRTWFVAHANKHIQRCCRYGKIRYSEGKMFIEQEKREWFWAKSERNGTQGVTANANGTRHSKWIQSEQPGVCTKTAAQPRRQSTRTYSESYWREFPTQSPLFDRNDGISARLDGITFPKWRNESIKGAGNAIVPQVVYQIFKAIEQYETLL